MENRIVDSNQWKMKPVAEKYDHLDTITQYSCRYTGTEIECVEIVRKFKRIAGFASIEI